MPAFYPAACLLRRAYAHPKKRNRLSSLHLLIIRILRQTRAKVFMFVRLFVFLCLFYPL
jgi:hypothetical protein